MEYTIFSLNPCSNGILKYERLPELILSKDES